jgi:hypothetical protein
VKTLLTLLKLQGRKQLRQESINHSMKDTIKPEQLDQQFTPMEAQPQKLLNKELLT